MERWRDDMRGVATLPKVCASALDPVRSQKRWVCHLPPWLRGINVHKPAVVTPRHAPLKPAWALQGLFKLF
eukprot:scaffold316407_cov30-Tisochrysis_lutea.AAC.3